LFYCFCFWVALDCTFQLSYLIIFSGEKISPLEIDAVLLSHPAVSEAVAFAAPDEHFGEEVFFHNNQS
jgi:acyl-CoA synthetase (AMP-forming)/AMP-acid ligase II